MSAIAEPIPKSPRLSDFQKRMRGIVGGNNKSGARPTQDQKPANLRTVYTLNEYKDVLNENGEKIVVVRFFATWCRACKKIQPAFYRMAAAYPTLALWRCR